MRSWRDYFFDIRVSLFSTGVLYVVAVAVSNQSTIGVSPLHPSQLLNYTLILVYVVGCASARPRVQAVLAVVVPAGLMAYLLTLLAEPDSVFQAAP